MKQEQENNKVNKNKLYLKQIGTIFYQFKKNKLTMVGFSMIIFLILIAFFSPLLVPYAQDATETSIERRLQPPNLQHFFGTDDLGRDVFSRVLLGSRISLKVGLSAILATMMIGVILGAISGYFGGWIDEIIMRITDIFLAFPNLLLAMAIAATLSPGLRSAMIAITLSWWPWYARLVRSKTMQLKRESFVLASIAMGANYKHILLKHILPNCIGPVIVNASLDMGYIILATASLGFIGVGAQPPLPEWGLMVSTGRKFFLDSPWIALFPGLAIFFTVLSFNLLGDGLRDLFDPKVKPR